MLSLFLILALGPIPGPPALSEPTRPLITFTASSCPCVCVDCSCNRTKVKAITEVADDEVIPKAYTIPPARKPLAKVVRAVDPDPEPEPIVVGFDRFGKGWYGSRADVDAIVATRNAEMATVQYSQFVYSSQPSYQSMPSSGSDCVGGSCSTPQRGQFFSRGRR